MAKTPWMKFFPTDWRADPALRSCSLAARGLWIDMLSIMHEAEPRGHLLIKSRKVTAKTLAMMVGTEESMVSELLDELRGAEVFSTTHGGIIFSRRMVKDDKISNIRSQSGKRGGDTSARARQESDESEAKVNRESGQSGGRTTASKHSQNDDLLKQNAKQNVEKPEARSQTPESKESSSAAKEKAESEFERDPEPFEAAPSVNGTPLPDIAKLESALVGASGYGLSLSDPFAIERLIMIEGASLELDVLPTVRAVAARMKKPPRGWSYFVQAIRDAQAARLSHSNGHAQGAPPQQEDRKVWDWRLGYGRKKHLWDVSSWGPMPHNNGCRAPPDLLRPDDGQDWQEWILQRD